MGGRGWWWEVGMLVVLEMVRVWGRGWYRGDIRG